MPEPCPFCAPNWPNLDIVERSMPVGPVGSVAVIRPLNPVTDGHVLVIHRDHDTSAAASMEASRRASLLMAVAADYVNTQGLQANIITSIGADATQTVMHTHVHVVPRRPGDGLTLPWTAQLSHFDRELIDQHFQGSELSRSWGPSGIYAKVRAFIADGLEDARARHDDQCEIRGGRYRFCDCHRRRALANLEAE